MGDEAGDTGRLVASPPRDTAMPSLAALAPSERACREQGRRQEPLLDVSRRLALQARRWLPGRSRGELGR